VSTEQEYDAQADMVDEQDPTESGPGPYPKPLPAPCPPQALNQHQQLGDSDYQAIQMGDNNIQSHNSITQLLGPHDPMLDMDPFGLSASMQFPAQFSFDTNLMRS
jgi:hypothetical protein